MSFRTMVGLALLSMVAPWSEALGEGKIGSGVADALGAKKGVRILVRARAGSLDPASIRALAVSRAAGGSPSPQVMLALRKRQAEADRKELGAFLRANTTVAPRPGTTAHVHDLRDLWCVNAYALEASAEMVRWLAGREDVERIVLDRKVKLLPARKTSDAREELAAPAGRVWGVGKIRAPGVWTDLAIDGKGVVIGHIDTGVDGAHPAFAGRILAFKDFTKGARSEPYDDEGHGSHTAGTIAGTTGGIGVAPGARLIVAKALDGQGSGELSGLLAAMQWMLDPDGRERPAAVNNSWGADRQALGDSEEMFRDAVRAWRDAGIVPLFSSGNSGPDTENVPGAYPEAFAVGATDVQDRDASFSSGSRSVWNGEITVRPDVAAPGVAVLSAAPGGGYKQLNGTSMACPHVSGVVALMVAANPSLTVQRIEKILEETALELGAEGKDVRFGSGRIDAFKAVKAARGRGALARR